MRLELRGHHVDVTPALRRLVGAELAKLERVLNNSAVSAQAILTLEKYRHRADITLHARGERFLYVWAGDQARQAPDFLAVVDFDEGSPRYGKVLNTVPLPGPGEAGNEPHHVGLSSDGRTLACGGLLSVLKGQKEIFFFDGSNGSPACGSNAKPC